MKYIIIVGKDYRDCKNTHNNIDKKQEDAKYVYVTKLKHLVGFEVYEVIFSKNAKENPKFAEINKTIKIIKTKKKNPIVKKLDKKIKKAKIKPEPIDDDFKKELDELIEKEEKSDVVTIEENVDASSISETLAEPTNVEIGENKPLGTENVFIGHKSSEEEQIVNEESIVETEDEKNAEVEEEQILKVEEETLNEEENCEIPAESKIKEKEEPELKEIKPVNPPRGWHAKNEYIDAVGNVFHKGKFVRNLAD